MVYSPQARISPSETAPRRPTQRVQQATKGRPQRPQRTAKHRNEASRRFPGDSVTRISTGNQAIQPAHLLTSGFGRRPGTGRAFRASRPPSRYLANHPFAVVLIAIGDAVDVAEKGETVYVGDVIGGLGDPG